MDRARRILTGKRGETLIECIASILVFTVLIASVTMMIMLSLRITGESMSNAETSQKATNAVLAGDAGNPDVDVLYPPGRIELEFGVGDILPIDVTVFESGGYTAFEP